jgi:hypothetical protein
LGEDPLGVDNPTRNTTARLAAICIPPTTPPDTTGVIAGAASTIQTAVTTLSNASSSKPSGTGRFGGDALGDAHSTRSTTTHSTADRPPPPLPYDASCTTTSQASTLNGAQANQPAGCGPKPPDNRIPDTDPPAHTAATTHAVVHPSDTAGTTAAVDPALHVSSADIQSYPLS